MTVADSATAAANGSGGHHAALDAGLADVAAPHHPVVAPDAPSSDAALVHDAGEQPVDACACRPDARATEPEVDSGRQGEGDSFSDIALTGAAEMSTIPVALSNGDGTFTVSNREVADFPSWAAEPGARPVPGDFDGDGERDIALVGRPGAVTVGVAFSEGGGAFRAVEHQVADFPWWSELAGNQPVPGDFNADGRTDIALVGSAGAWSIAVAFSKGDGSFTVTNKDVTDFAAWAALTGAQPVAGDFDGDGYGDIALTGIAEANTIPVAFSNGDGTFRVTNSLVPEFPGWAQIPGNKAVPGDFNGDRRGDIALLGVRGAWSIAVALSNGNGTFAVFNETRADFAAWAAEDGAQPVVGDFNGDGRGDIALTGMSSGTTIPVAFSNGDATFRVTNEAVMEFPAWSQRPGMNGVGG